MCGKTWSCLRSLLALPSLRISAKVLTYMIASTLGLSGSQEGKRLLFAPPSSWYLNSSGRVASLWSPDRTHPQRQHQCALFNTFEFGTLEATMILQVVDWKGYFLRILSTNPLPWSSLPFLYHKTEYWHFLNCKRLFWSSDFLSKGWRFSGCFIAKQDFPKCPTTDWQVQTYLGRDLMPGFEIPRSREIGWSENDRQDDFLVEKMNGDLPLLNHNQVFPSKL